LIVDSPILDALLFVSILIPSIIAHEVAHGVIALRLGDTTARDAGRLTPNPAPHIDPFGSLLLPGMLALAGQPVFGWAKPVPVDPRHFDRPTRGMATTALAGPVSNLVLAAAIGAIGPFGAPGDRTCELFFSSGALADTVCLTSDSMLARFLIAALIVNVALALFNLLPIPPLDGSRLVPLFLGPQGRRTFARFSQYGLLLLFLLVFVFDDALSFLGDWIAAVVGVLT
jgi:Zn-dependent protease